jgi:hypothetical protein
MVDLSQIQEHMEVVGSDGRHVGVVDAVVGPRLKLARTDPAAGGEHHFVPVAAVAAVEGGTVRLSRTAAQTMDEWGSETVAEGVRGDAPGSPTAGP